MIYPSRYIKYISCTLFFLLIGLSAFTQEVGTEEPANELTDIEGEKEEIEATELEEKIKAYLYGGKLDLQHLQPEQLEAFETLLKAGNLDFDNLNFEDGDLIDDVLFRLFPPPQPSSIYGHQIFREDSVTIFEPASFTKVSDAYTLGSGDEILISIFGASQFDAAFEISKDGYIQPKKMPKIFLKGLKWEQAKKLIQNRFKVFYLFRPEQFAISLTKPRTVLVNILGEVEKPGSYNLVATNTAFNALLAAGGPKETGSVRQIRLIRGTTIKELDIYELMSNPSVQFDFSLEDNDIIQVPTAKKIVQIDGGINRPLRYELKEEEGMEELIDFAGGLAANAYKEQIQIRRFTDDAKILLDLDWLEQMKSKQNYALQNGDEIIVKIIANTIDNSVFIEGGVDLPGEYALETTRRLTDLITKAKIKNTARLDVAFLIRTNQDSTSSIIQLNLEEVIQQQGTAIDLLLQAKDRLVIYEQNRYVDKDSIRIVSGVRESPIVIPFDSDSTITIQRAILLGGGLTADATDFGYILRTNLDETKEYIKVDVKAALNNQNDLANIVLQPKDQLYIFQKNLYRDSVYVSIEGAVRRPLDLEYSPSMSLKDLFIIAGGFKLEAALNRIEIYRLELDGLKTSRISVATFEVDEDFNIVKGDKNFTLMPYDKVVVHTIAGYEAPTYVKIEGEVLHPGTYALVKKNETILSAIQRAGGLTVEAFPEGTNILRADASKIIIDLPTVLKKTNSRDNIFLRSGDIITIPKKKDLITINLEHTKAKELVSSFNKPLSVTYKVGKSAKWYIQEYAAGFGKDAAKNNVTVEYANGAIKSTKKILLFRKYPTPEAGGIIRIGAKPEKEESSRKLSKRTRKINSNALELILRGVEIPKEELEEDNQN